MAELLLGFMDPLELALDEGCLDDDLLGGRTLSWESISMLLAAVAAAPGVIISSSTSSILISMA